MYNYKAKMINVVDGDTMDFEIDLGFKIHHIVRVRLFGIDTPEIYHYSSKSELKHGKDAKKHVETYFLNETGILKTQKDKTGKYGRYIANFTVIRDSGDVDNIVESLIRNGFEKCDVYL